MKSLFKIEYWKRFFILIEIDFNKYKKEFLNKIFDNAIVVISNVMIMAHIMQKFGLNKDYGLFIHTGLLGSISFWGLYPFIADVVYDFDHSKRITYDLSLPIPTSFIFFRRIISFAIENTIITLAMFPIGKIFLFNQFYFFNLSIFKAILFIFLQSIFCGSFGIFTSTIVKTGKNMGMFWNRILFPIWIFGGYNFSWKVMNETFKIFSYISLFNPMIYITEGIRAIYISNQIFIPLYICFIAIIIFSAAFTFFGIKRLRKFLDFV